MLWILMSVLAVAGALFVRRRRRQGEVQHVEPWRASLVDDEPLDLEEIRRAEDEWLADDEWAQGSEDEEWR